MRRGEAGLPPVSQLAVRTEKNGPLGGTWQRTERKSGIGYTQPQCILGRGATRLKGKTPRGDGAEGDRRMSEESSPPHPSQSSTAPEPPSGEHPRSFEASQNLISEQKAGMDQTESALPKSVLSATKVRSIESWLDSTLERVGNAEHTVSKTSSMRKDGLTKYSVDSASLENVGITATDSQRIHRALMVYSQGLHTLLNDVVSSSLNRNQAMLVLWKAFTAVLENAGPEDHAGDDSLAAIVQKGNAEEKALLQSQFYSQISKCEADLKKSNSEKRSAQEQLATLKEEESRLLNQNEMHRSEHAIAIQKFELEIRRRMETEISFLNKSHWAATLQEDLDKQVAQNMHLSTQLNEANTQKDNLNVELDTLKTKLYMFEAQSQEFEQQSLETTQQRLRHEHQIQSLKSQLQTTNTKLQENKEAFESHMEKEHELHSQITQNARDMRKIETQLEDESALRAELQDERDILRKRLDALDKEMNDLSSERRHNLKDISDMRMKQRTDEIELVRNRERVAELEKAKAKADAAHAKLVDDHRHLCVEAERLREDVTMMSEQLKKESNTRKALQLERTSLVKQLETITLERDDAQTAVARARAENVDVTKRMMKMESVVKANETAKQKLTAEHSAERRAQAKQVALLEKVIADERELRREIADEVEEAMRCKVEAEAKLDDMGPAVRELKKKTFEWETQADHYKILCTAEQRRADELLVDIDSHHAAVANHDGEMRQMHLLLEKEREEAQRSITELTSAYEASRKIMERTLDMWQMRFEDALSLLHFNPATRKIHVLQKENKALKTELAQLRAQLESSMELIKAREGELGDRGDVIGALQKQIIELRQKVQDYDSRYLKILQLYERRSMAMIDSELQNDRLKESMDVFDQEREALEDKIEALLKEKSQVVTLLNKSRSNAGVQAMQRVRDNAMQTDLSYQYLENCQDGLHGGPRRGEQLMAMKKAGHFLEDPEEQRDFTVNCTTGNAFGKQGDVFVYRPGVDQPRKNNLVHSSPNRKFAGRQQRGGPGRPQAGELSAYAQAHQNKRSGAYQQIQQSPAPSPWP